VVYSIFAGRKRDFLADGSSPSGLAPELVFENWADERKSSQTIVADHRSADEVST
jgi:hypothetical protein